MSEEATVLSLAAQWRARGETVALATVIETWGSAPRPVGSLMAVSSHDQVAGSVSGGCVETAVIQAVRQVMATGVPRLLAFQVADNDAFAVGLPCGGSMRVFVERIG